MKTALIFFVVAGLFLVLFLYFFDLILFWRREKKRFDGATDYKEYVALLEAKQKKTKHPQKKNFFLYLICLAWIREGEKGKASRLVPFLKKDSLLGVSESFLKEKTE